MQIFNEREQNYARDICPILASELQLCFKIQIGLQFRWKGLCDQKNKCTH